MTYCREHKCDDKYCSHSDVKVNPTSPRSDQASVSEDVDYAKVMLKIATIPEILKAAGLLHKLGLQTELPNETVKRYVLANPDINEAISRTSLSSTNGDGK
jgi:hypothetical protein